MHDSLSAQAVSQEPQFPASSSRLTQPSLHSEFGSSQAQKPETQLLPASQLEPSGGSISPSQSLSRPSQSSAAPANVSASSSLQSMPPQISGATPSLSPSRNANVQRLLEASQLVVTQLSGRTQSSSVAHASPG